MNLEHPEKSAELQPSTDGQAPKANRRKLIQTGLAGAPLLMALKSVPALAAECKQPSGFSASGNLSQNGTAPCAPKMNGVTFWQAYAAANPPTVDDLDNKTFGGVFTASAGRTETIRAIITGTDTAGDAPLERQIVAAWLSAKAGSPLFTAAQAIAMWNEGVVGGSWHPNPSVPSVSWGKVQVKQYLDYVLNA